MSDPRAPTYDPFDAAVLASPFAAYEDLRQQCRCTSTRLRRARASTASPLRRRRRPVPGHLRWSADWGQGPLYVKEGGLKSDPPEHTRYRRLVTGAFTAARTAALEPLVRRTASALIDAFVAAGRTELVDSYGAPLPMNIIVSVLGVPADRGRSSRRGRTSSWPARTAPTRPCRARRGRRSTPSSPAS